MIPITRRAVLLAGFGGIPFVGVPWVDELLNESKPQPAAAPAGKEPSPPTVKKPSAPTVKRPPSLAGKPRGYPPHIKVVDVQAVLAKLALSGQACGLAKWEGRSWGFYVNFYDERPMTRWCDHPVSIYADFVQGEEDHYLISVTIDEQVYRRDNRNETLLRWSRDLRKKVDP